jgi:transmembrane sensor
MDIQPQGWEAADRVLRYLQGDLHGEELRAFEQWLAEDPRNRQLVEKLQDSQVLQEGLDFMSTVDTEGAWQKVALRTERQGKVRSLGARFLPYAAALLLLAGGAAVYFSTRPPGPASIARQVPARPSVDTTANADKTRLVLADGSVIVLDAAANGTLRQEGGVRVAKKDGEIVYEVLPGAGATAAAYHTLSTPAGGQIRIVLPDGSRAWLNAASSLRFPSAFHGGERKVALTGEGYFEVAPNKAMPFRVETRGGAIEVLGTHFNVMAYDNEGVVRTTLLEGSVKVGRGAESRVLKPGYAASIQGEAISVAAADVEEAVAWKEGRFQFHQTGLQTIMRQLERWYGVEVHYTAGVKEERFSGTIPRSATAAQVLEMLELTRTVKFTMEGKKITARPY